MTAAGDRFFQEFVQHMAEGVYVVSRDHYDLLYVNEKMEQISGIKPSASCKCYQALRGRTEPCRDCAAHRGDGQPHLYYHPGLDRTFAIRTTPVDWNGTPAYAIVCSDATELAELKRQAQCEGREMENLIDSIPGGIAKYILTPGGLRVLYCSAGFAEMLGMTREEYIERFAEQWQGNIYPADRPAILKCLEDCVKRNKSIDYTYRLMHQNGSILWVNLQARMVGTQRGCPVLHAVFHALSAATALYRQLLDGTDTVVQVSDLDTKELLYVNQAAAAFAGRGKDDLCGKKCYEYMFGASEPCPFCNLEKNPCFGPHGEIRVDERCFDVQSARIQWNGRDAFVEYVNDVTDTWKLRRQLESDKEKMETLINNIPTGVVLYRIREDGRVCVENCNYAFCGLFGVEESELMGADAASILWYVHPDDRDRVIQTLFCITRGEFAEELDCRACGKKDHSYRWFHICVKMACRQPDFFCYSTYIDITAQKQGEAAISQKALELNRLVSELEESKSNLEMAAKQADLQYWQIELATGAVRVGRQPPGQEQTTYNIRDPQFGKQTVVDEDFPYYTQMTQKVVSGEAPHVSFDVRMRGVEHKQEVWSRISYDLISDGEGRPVRLFGIAQDITFYKQLEKQYQEAVEYRRTITDNLIASCRVNLTQGVVEDLFHQGESIFRPEYAAYTEYTQRVSLFLEHLDLSDEDNEKLSLAGLLRRYESGDQLEPIEYMAYLKGEHRIVWVRVDVKIVQQPNTHDMVAFFYNRDMTQQYIVANATDAMLKYDCDYCSVIFLSNHHVHVLSKPGNTVLPEPFYEDYSTGIEGFLQAHCGDGKLAEALERTRLDAVLRALEESDIYTVDYTLREQNGSLRRKQLRYSYSDREHGIIVQTRLDVEDMIRAETAKQEQLTAALAAAERANHAKSDFLSRMSHDIRTPMNAIIGMTEIAMDRTDNPEETVDCLHKIDSSSHFLLGLINDILDVSKIESGALSLSPEPYLLTEFQEQINMMIRPLCEQKRLSFELVTEIRENSCILVDKVRFNQIFFNLLSNAVKYTPSGGTVVLSVEHLWETDHKIGQRICVRDTGIGISKEFQAHMFEVFTQADDRHIKETAGTGLGLSIVKSLVELMGGTITVHSELGVGSEFCVELEVETAQPPRKEQQIPLARQADLANAHVLLCEDHPVNAQIAVRLLEKVGIHAVLAENGLQGVTLFAQSEPGGFDAILMDIRMPELDGLEATRRIRAMDRPDAATVPIIAMTANAFDDDRHQSLAAGMNDHLSKPIEPQRLYEVLMRYIRA